MATLAASSLIPFGTEFPPPSVRTIIRPRGNRISSVSRPKDITWTGPCGLRRHQEPLVFEGASIAGQVYPLVQGAMGFFGYVSLAKSHHMDFLLAHPPVTLQLGGQLFRSLESDVER
jgi:hypothetical protein